MNKSLPNPNVEWIVNRLDGSSKESLQLMNAIWYILSDKNKNDFISDNLEELVREMDCTCNVFVESAKENR